MGRICTVAIHKGGTGKTTVSAHLAFLAAELGSRTLLIDLDSQGNASDTVLLETANLDAARTASDLFEESEPMKPILNARPKLDVLPGRFPLTRRRAARLRSCSAFQPAPQNSRCRLRPGRHRYAAHDGIRDARAAPHF
jgi:cellulose biosynthesis protein BcsQ